METCESNYKGTTPDVKTSSLLYTDVAHPKELLTVFQSMREHEELCDVVLCVGQQRINAHKAILCACSAYFRAMFTGGLIESDLNEVVLHIHEVETFQLIIDYFYTSKLEIKDENVQELLSLSGLLQLRRVQQSCCEYLKRKICVENCLGIASFAETHSCPQLYQHAHSYAVQHFVDVVQCEEFLNISFEHLIKIISEDSLNVHSEERVFEAAVAWIKHSFDERSNFSLEVFQKVRFPLLTKEFLMDRVAKEDIIRNDRGCSDLLFDAFRHYLLHDRVQVLPRKATSSYQVLYAVGGMSRREATKSAERYDPKEGRWKAIGDMNTCRFGAAISSHGSNLFICGGSDDASRLDTVERYDPFNNAWIPITSMSSKRNGVGVVARCGKIYAVGGFDGSTPLNSVECYDIKLARWSSVAPMNQARFGVGCCVLNDIIYALGGSDGSNLRTCEIYNPETNKWTEISPMSVARKQVACASVGGFVYAIGGTDVNAVSGVDSARYSTVERYDPVVDQWIMMAPLMSPRSGAGVGVLDGFLYVCGGFDGKQYLNTVENKQITMSLNVWYLPTEAVLSYFAGFDRKTYAMDAFLVKQQLATALLKKHSIPDVNLIT